MTPVNELSDSELRSALIALGFSAGPVTGTTRKLYEKKLEALRKSTGTIITTAAAVQPKPKPAAVKKTPTKNAAEPPQPLLTTPLSAKRKGLKVQAVEAESSDNELELTVSSENASAISTRSFRAGSNKNAVIVPTLLSAEHEHSPPRPIAKRTPTPPRSSGSASKRTPLRLSNTNDSSFSVHGNIFGGDEYLPSTTNRFSNSYAAANSFEEDDHMETSRIVSPGSRFEPFRSSLAPSSDYRKPTRPFAPNNNESPIEKLRRFSRGAWGFFSRPMHSSTPCADSAFGGKSYQDSCQSAARYTRYSKYSPNKPLHSKANPSDSCDVSAWILVTVFSFLVILVVAYFFTANPKTIESGRVILLGAVRDTFDFFYTYAIFPLVVTVIVIATFLGIYQFHKYREATKIEHKNKLMELVDRITDVIRDTQNEGIAELHVRDILMPPTKRSSDDWKRWKEAAEFINLEDSRVRTEVRLVDGDECNVWVWVPAAKQKWQGTAIAESSLAHNVPSKALTRCIKLRGITFTERLVEANELRSELFKKLSPIIPVHMEFVVAPENIVYMMLKDLQDAKDAFAAFHSHWFKGSLISAKYVRDERYMERFADVKSLY